MGELWGRRGEKKRCNTTIKEPGMWEIWLNDRQAGGGALGGGGKQSTPSFLITPALFGTFFFLSEIFLKQIGICFWQV